MIPRLFRLIHFLMYLSYSVAVYEGTEGTGSVYVI